MIDHLEKIKAAIVNGSHKEIEEMVRLALGDNVGPETLVNDAMIPGMDEVGQKFSEKEIFVPEMLVSAVTMTKGLDILKPILKKDGVESKAMIVMCTVRGDVHDIGKNLVMMMLEGAGFEVVNMGVDKSVENVIEKVRELKPAVLGLSSMLTTTMPEMQKVIESLEACGLRQNIKVMVGGAPVDAAFAEKIRADGYGGDAAEAVRIAKALTESG